MTLQLSKSRYTAGLQCEKRLWLEVHKPELRVVDDNQRSLFDMGAEIGVHARKLYPDGLLIEEDHRHISQAIASTEKAAQAGIGTLFEPAVSHQNVVARADILTRSERSGAWDMVEVKSVLSVKDAHVHDMAVQKWVFEGAGYPIHESVLCHINRDYVRQGPLDWNRYFKLEDITKRVKTVLPTVGKRVGVFFAVAEGAEEPGTPIGSRCREPYDCPFIGYCWKGMPENNIFDLCGARTLPDELYAKGVRCLADIPKDVKLKKNQSAQVEVARTGKMVWHVAKVSEFLGQFRYPIHFLDFEADNPAIPLFDGTRPKQKIPFQYSMHVLDKLGGKRVHHEFLGDGITDPREALADSLAKALGPQGSVVAYWAAYEKEVLAHLGGLYPRHAPKFNSAIARMLDLETPFRNRAIVHPGFCGSSSLKVVLPSLVPEMSYENLTVSDGLAAVWAYQRLSKPETAVADRMKIRSDLLEYCGQDTLAMVRLFETLTDHA